MWIISQSIRRKWYDTWDCESKTSQIQSLGGSFDFINLDGLNFSPNRGQKTSSMLLVLSGERLTGCVGISSVQQMAPLRA